MRTGLIAKKLGMTRVYNEQRIHNSVTVLEVPDIKVIGQKNKEKDGYDALVIGAGATKQKKLNKPQKEFFSKANIEPLNKIKEFRVSKDNFVEAGAKIMASHFVVGQYVDVKAISIGKGFAGAMKRHNFAGLRASHGVSISHRSHGSTGNSQDPGRVWKGKKMAGQLGNKKVTIQSLEVVSIDEDRGLVLVKGGVPGSVGSWVSLSDAKKKSLPANVPYPAGTKKLQPKIDDVAEKKPEIEVNAKNDKDTTDMQDEKKIAEKADNKNTTKQENK